MMVWNLDNHSVHVSRATIAKTLTESGADALVDYLDRESGMGLALHTLDTSFLDDNENTTTVTGQHGTLTIEMT